MKIFRVLIVEDLPKDADYLRAVLEKVLLEQIADSGIDKVEAEIVTNQEDADKAVLDTDFDLVLLDLRYPEVPDGPLGEDEDEDAEFQGMRWLPALRRAQPRATVVILTSFAYSNDLGTAVQAVRDCQAHDVVPKNIEMHDLVTRIVLACENSRRVEVMRKVHREFRSLIHSRFARTYAEDLARILEQSKARFSAIARRLESGDPAAPGPAAEDIRESFDVLRKEFIQLTELLSEGEDHRGEVDVAEILRDFAILYEDRFREAKAHVEPPADDLLLKCTTYASDLKIALHEVIVNAAESLERSQNTNVKDRCCRLFAEAINGDVKIVVLDNGPGFSDYAVERMFQLPERRDDVQPGRGKGLYVAQRMMHSIGGSIQAQNLLENAMRVGAKVVLTVKNLPAS